MAAKPHAHWWRLSLLLAGVVASLPVASGAGNLRQAVEAWRLPAAAGATRFPVQKIGGRKLTGYQTCAAALNGEYAPWVITCGGPSAICGAPYCPIGFTADTESDQCTIAPNNAPSNVYWLTNLCKPWTVLFLLVGPSTWSVDDEYRVVAQAIGPDGLISIQEVRPVLLTLDDHAGAGLRTWPIPISSGQGSVNITHTVAEEVTLRLQGANYSSDVSFPSLNVTFIAGATTMYRFTQSSLSGTVDDPISVEVEARDQYGNLAQTEQRGLVVNWSLTTNRSIGSSGNVDFSDGIGNIDVRSTRPGTFLVLMESSIHSTADISDTMQIAFGVGAIAEYVFRHEPATLAVPVGGVVQVYVDAVDQYRNRVPTEQRDVEVVATGGTGAGVVDIVNGEGSVAISHNVAEAVTLSLNDVSSTGLGVTDTLTLIFGPGELGRVGLSASRTSGTVDGALRVKVQALDGYGNLVTDEDRGARIVVDGDCSASPMDVFFTNGEGTSDISCMSPRIVTVGLADLPAPHTTGVDLSDTLNLTFGHGQPAGFALRAPLSGIVGQALSVTVLTVDQYGNDAPVGSHSVTVLSTGSAVVSNDGLAELTNGQAALVVRNTVAETAQLYLEDTFATGFNATSVARILFLPGPPARYVFKTEEGAEFVVGTSATISVGVQDEFGNDVTDEQRDVTVTAPADVTGAGLVTIANGAGTISLSYTVAEDVQLALSDTESTGLDTTDTVEVTFIAAAARSIVLVPAASSGTVDAPIAVHLEARDRFNNLARSETRAFGVSVPSSHSTASPSSVSLILGRGTTQISSTLATSVLVSIEDTGGTGLEVTATATLQFLPGVPTQVGISAPPSVEVGIWANVTLLALDQYGNQANQGSYVLALMTTGSAVVPSNGLAVMTDGVASVVMRNLVAEAVTLSIGDTLNSGLDTSATAVVQVEAAAAVRFGFASTLVTTTVDESASLEVRALDPFGNVDESFDRDVSVSFGDDQRRLVDIFGGQGVAQITSTTVQTIAVSLVDTEGTGLDVTGTCDARFLAGDPASVTVEAGAGSVDAPVTVRLRALDQYGNPTARDLPAENGRRLTANGFWVRAVVTGSSALGGGRVDIVQGQGETQVSTTVAQTVTVELRDDGGTGLDLSGTSSIIFSPGAPVRAALRLPATAVVGAAVDVTVEPRDQYENVALTGPQLTVVANRNAVVAGGGRVDLGSGSTSVSVSNNRTQTVVIAMTDASDSTFSINETQTLEFRAGPARRVGFQASALTTTVDDGASANLQAYDAYDNLADSFEGSITVYKADSPTETVLAALASGIGTALVSHRQVGTVELALDDTESTGLSVAGASLTVTFNPGVAASVDLLPVSATTATVLDHLDVQLIARDAFGNEAVSPVTVQVAVTGSAVVAASGAVTLSQGRGTARITDNVAEQVRVSMQDPLNLGLALSDTVDLTFQPGPIYRFVTTRTDGTTNFIFQTGTMATWQTVASDFRGNLISTYGVLQMNAVVTPIPDGYDDGLISWMLYDGTGTSSLQVDYAVVFSIDITSAEERSSGGGGLSQQTVNGTTHAALLAQAVARTPAFQIQFKVDAIPPTWNDIDVTINGNDAIIDIIGLDEPAFIWCMAVPPGTAAPQTPATSSDDIVYLSLRGGEVALTGPRQKIGLVQAGDHTLTLTSLDSGTSYVIRCIGGDESDNMMPGDSVSSSEVPISIPEDPIGGTDGDGGGGDGDDGLSDETLAIILGLVGVALLCCLPLLCLACLIWRRLPKDKRSQSQKIAPAPDPSDPKGSQAAVPLLSSDSIDKTPEDEVPEDKWLYDMDEDDRTLREAEEMRLQLIDELRERGVIGEGDDMLPGWEDDDEDDSDFSAASDASAVLRDVQKFLHKQEKTNSFASMVEADASLLPELPLTLSGDDEERLDALAALGKKDGVWESKLQRFDDLWNAADGEIWAGALPIVRAEQLEYREKINATMAALAEAKKTLEAHPETYEVAILDGLTAEEERFSKETDKHLRLLHQLAIDWPDEDAVLRGKIVEEWTPKIAGCPKKEERTQLRQDAVTALRKLSDEREEALEVELFKLEQDAGSSLEAIREDQAKMWRGACDKIDSEAAGLRKECADLKYELTRLAWQAEKSALEAVLRVRSQIRDAAVDRDTQKELEELDQQHTEHRAKIMELCNGDSEHATFERERALTMLQRAWQAARKEALDEKARRQRHWHEIVEERGRDRLRALQHRLADEERKLSDEASKIEEQAHEDEARRRTVLILGATHRAEVSMLTCTATARRSRILMNLQATAADTVAEERLPRKNRETAEGDGMSKTANRWQAAKRRVADELNAAVGLVSKSLTEHSQRQRTLLAQTQRREAFLAGQQEGDDEKREDLLDALEENMRREIRATRWDFQKNSAEGMLTSYDGKETELGKRLVSVERDSDLLAKEDEIGERYDRLRALVLGLGQAGEDEAKKCAAAQQEAKELEKQAAKLRAEAAKEYEDFGDNASEGSEDVHSPVADTAKELERLTEELAKLKEQRAADEEEERQRLEALREARQKRRESAMQRAKELAEQGKTEEAMAVIAEALRQDALDDEAAARLAGKPFSIGVGTDGDLADQMDQIGEETMRTIRRAYSDTEAARQARLRRRLTAELKAKELLDQGQMALAMEVLANALAQTDADEAAEAADLEAKRRRALDPSTSEAERNRLLAELAAREGRVGALTAEELEEQRRRMEALRAARKKKMQDARVKALELAAAGQGQEALQVMMDAMQEDEEAEKAGRVPFDVFISEADRKKLRDDLAAAKDRMDQKTLEDIEAQRNALEARREARRRRRESAEQQARALSADGKHAEAMEVLLKASAEIMTDEDAEAAEEEERRRRALDPSVSEEERARLLAEFAAKEGRTGQLTAEELEEQRRRMEELRNARRKKLKDMQDKAKQLQSQGMSTEAIETMIDALRDNESAERSSRAPFDLFISEAERAKLRAQLEANKDHANSTLAEDLDAQHKRLEAARLARQRRREAAAEQAKDLIAKGRHDEAMVLMEKVMAEIQAEEDDEAAEEERKRRRALDPSVSAEERARLLAELAAREGRTGTLTAEEVEEQRRRMEALREARKKKRQEAQQLAQQLQAQGKGKEAMDMMVEAMEENERSVRAARAPFDLYIYEAERARLREKAAKEMEQADGLSREDREAQRQNLEARRKARQKRRDEAEQRAQELTAEGKSEEALKVLEKAMSDIAASEAMDAAEEKKRHKRLLDTSVSEADRARLRNQFLQGQKKVGEIQSEHMEAQRQRMQEAREARRKRREAAQAKALELQAKGDHEKAMEVLTEVMQTQQAPEATDVVVEDVTLAKTMSLMNAAEEGKQAVDAEVAKLDAEQRRKLEARKARRQWKREEAEQKAKDLQAKGKYEEAMQVLIAAMKEEEMDMEGEEEESLKADKVVDAWGTAKSGGFDKAGLVAGLDEQAEAADKERDAQRQRMHDRRASIKARREQALREAESLEDKAAELHLQALMGDSKEATEESKEDYDLIGDFQEAARRRAIAGAVAASVQKGQEAAAKRLVDTPEQDAAKAMLKDGFAKEMEKCEAAFAGEREQQRQKAMDRIADRKKKREEQEVAEANAMSQPKTVGGMAVQKVHKVVRQNLRPVMHMKHLHKRRRGKMLQEHMELETRLKAEHARELKTLEIRLRKEAEEEMKKLKAKLQLKEAKEKIDLQRTVTGEKTDVTALRAHDSAHLLETQTRIKKEQTAQAMKTSARVAARRNKFANEEKALELKHQQEEVKAEFAYEKEKFQGKEMSKMKPKALVKELQKVNGIIATLNNNREENREMAAASSAAAAPPQDKTTSAPLAPPMPPPAPPKAGRMISAPPSSAGQPLVPPVPPVPPTPPETLPEGTVKSGSSSTPLGTVRSKGEATHSSRSEQSRATLG